MIFLSRTKLPGDFCGIYLRAQREVKNRVKIINLLQETHLNINRMAEVLNLNYKAVQHHVDVLEKNNLISRMGKKYGIMYFVSNYLESNIGTYRELVSKISKSKSYKI